MPGKEQKRVDLLEQYQRMVTNKSRKGFSQWLENFRTDKGYSVNRLAKISGISASYMRYLLEGKREPSLNSVFKIAEGLQVPIEELLFTFVDKEINAADGVEYVSFVHLTNFRQKQEGDRGGQVSKITDKQLVEHFGPEASVISDGYLKKYLWEIVYKSDYEEYRRERFLEQTAQGIKDAAQTPKEVRLNKILSSLYDFDERGLSFIEAQLQIYQKYCA